MLLCVWTDRQWKDVQHDRAGTLCAIQTHACSSTCPGTNLRNLQNDAKSEAKGLILRCVESLFSSIKDLQRGGRKVTVHISFIEIYQEHVRDLGKAVTRLQEAGQPSLWCNYYSPHWTVSA
jgi:Kinesin motor domain